jgi:hypothetical protein
VRIIKIDTQFYCIDTGTNTMIKVQTNDGVVHEIVPDEMTLFEGADEPDEIFPLYNITNEIMLEIIKFMSIEREEFAINIVYGDMTRMVKNPAYAALVDTWFNMKPYAEYFNKIKDAARYLGYDRLLKLLNLKIASISYNLKFEEVCWIVKDDEKRLGYYRKVLKETYFKLPDPVEQKEGETPDERRHRLAVKYDIENRPYMLKDCLIMDPLTDYDKVMTDDAFALSMLEKGRISLLEKKQKKMTTVDVGGEFAGMAGAGAGSGAAMETE